MSTMNIEPVGIPTHATGESPFERRALILGHGVYLEEWERWIEEAREAGLNSIFFHTIPGALALGAAPEALYRAVRDRAVRAARSAGMAVEWGGHHLSSLIPRSLFRSRPELFRFHEGRRRPDANFCVSNPETLETLTCNARTLFREHPEVDVFHIWADDLPGGGWCDCPECRKLSPSEQYLRAFEALSETLEEERPNARLSFLAYYDTETLPISGRFRSNAELLWAPRPRCYAHGAGDTTCPMNHPAYGQAFQETAAAFRRAGGRHVSVFEYWLDGILFKSVVPPMPTVLAEDLRFYAQAGANSVGILLTGDRPLPSTGPNLRLFGRLAESLSRDPQAELERFCSDAYGPAAGAMAVYWRHMENAWRPLLTRKPGDTILSVPSGYLDLVSEPYGEPGDPKDAGTERLSEIVEGEWAAFDSLKAAGRQLSLARELLSNDADSEASAVAALKAEAVEYDLHGYAMEFCFLRARAYLDRSNGNDSEAAGYALLALQSAREIGDWGVRNLLDRRARKNFSFLNLLYRTLPMRALLRSGRRGGGGKTVSWLVSLAELAYSAFSLPRLWEPREVRR